MKIDGNEKCIRQNDLDRAGKKKEAYDLKMEFLREVKQSGIDHCSCPEACVHHGNCYECVILHRGHRDHLPFCFWDMVNEQLYGMSRLTEGSLAAYAQKKEAANE